MKFTLIYGTAALAGRLARALEIFDAAMKSLREVEVSVVDLSAPQHFLANEANLHPILGWFGAMALPGIYLTSRSFEDGALTAEAREQVGTYAASFHDLASRLAGAEFRPRPLAATARA